jgi:hypothetical protein
MPTQPLFAKEMVVDWGLVFSIAGFLGTVFFGVQSLAQSIERKAQERALRAYSQGMYNTLSRMGAGAEALLRSNDFNEAKQVAMGVHEVSQAARNWVIAFSKEHAQFAPYAEAAWDPSEVPPQPRPFWRRILMLR